MIPFITINYKVLYIQKPQILELFIKEIQTNYLLPLSFKTGTTSILHIKFEKEDYTYHQTYTTKIVKNISYNFNPISNAWDNEFVSQKEYNSSGKITLDQYFDWDITIGNWILKREYLYTYNSTNVLISEIYRTFDISSGSVVNSTIDEMSYDANNNLLEKIRSNWNIPSGNWVLYRKELYTYSSTNKKLSYENLYWTATAGWTGFYKSLYTYNSSDILIETINQNYEHQVLVL